LREGPAAPRAPDQVNLRLILKILGLFTGATALSMLAALAWALMDGTDDRLPLLGGIGAGLALGLALYLPNRRVKGEIHRREGFAIVTLSWAMAALAGAVPFYLYPGDAFPTFLDAYFEAMSGFTTTGASVLADIEALPRGLLFWRSLTHWLGGMGIIVLFVAVLPFLGVGGRQLFRSEVPGVDKGGLTPRIRETARLLWLIYVGLSLIETVLLRLGGMDLYESLCHTFGTMATGGFSTRNASIGAYHSLWVEGVILVFMVLAGFNFALYNHALRGRVRRLLRDRELHVYLGLLVAFFLLLAVILMVGMPGMGAGEATRQAAFQGVSIMTTTGYATTDTDRWPQAARFLLVVMMWVGGSAGSTAGGMKVVRVALLAKIAYLGVYRTFRPHEVKVLYFGGKAVGEQVQQAITFFALVGMAVFILASLVLLATGCDLVTGVSAVVANLWNIGPGLGEVGSAHHYGHLPALAKVVLVLCQLMGRLELMTVLVLFLPAFWERAGRGGSRSSVAGPRATVGR